jgi:predicted metalloprotease with PDZ domain
LAFTVTMPKPDTHYFHVTFRAEGLKGEFHDFKMPVWAPGFYRILDFPKNVARFHVSDGNGHELPWEKVTRNSWRVVTGNAPAVVLDYDVFGNTTFGVQNFLAPARGYISPPGLFVYPVGELRQPVTVTIQPPPGWAHISSGLDPVEGRANTYSAADFDILYDCPILLGNHEVLRFEAGGRPHYVAIENVSPVVDRSRMLADLKRMVEAATALMGDVPYRHYTFLMMGTGNGGIEHLNSASISFNGKSLETPDGYLRWLSYVAHEYFHNFNVKRIRPLALGPFDYDGENLTSMLWVSEGLSVYYQDLLLVRAGLMTRAQYLDKMRASIARFENAGGRHYQSATDSSLTTWGTSGVGNDRNTTISYYDNGGMLGAMLDLKIRAASENRRSLDDVMRALYRTYYQEKRRGFTDAEFRAACESAAGAPLEEVFSYASTTRPVDYAKYFALAGLELTDATEPAPGSSLGINTQTADGKLVVVTSATSGINPGDQIVEVEGAKATPKVLSDLLAARQPGDRLDLHLSRGDVQVTLTPNVKHTYTIRPASNPTNAQTAILNDWLRGPSGSAP